MVTAGTPCARNYTSTTGGSFGERLLSVSGTWARTEGDNSIGLSTWSMVLVPGTEVLSVLTESCGQRGSLPADDYSTAVGCTAATIDDRSAERPIESTVLFGGASGERDSPKCLQIAVGQAVTFKGPFDTYVLNSGTPGATQAGSQPNPVVFRPAGTEGAFTFSEPGDFLYHCSNQPDAEMMGLIRAR